MHRASLKCTDTRGQKFRPNNIHYAFISIVMILVTFLRENHYISERFRVFTSNTKLTKEISRIPFYGTIIQSGRAN